jgi:hypothetical protein
MSQHQSEASDSRNRLLLAALLLIAVGGLAAFFLMSGRDGDIKPGEAETVIGESDESLPESVAAADGEWESEQLAETAGNQLKELAHLLDETSMLNAESLQALVTAEIKGTPLRPAEFEDRYQAGSLTVRRGLIPGDGPSIHGAEQFAAALNALTEPLAGADQLHSKFKVISVDLESAADSIMTTDVIFQRVGTLNDGSFQQDATWRCVWRMSSPEPKASADGLLLEQVLLLDYEETLYTSPQQHLFSDCTESVFRNEPTFQQQLVPGIDYWRSLGQRQYGVLPFGHHGIAVGDVNGDGLDDLYAGQPIGLPNRLYVQNPDGTVSDIAADAGVDLLNRTRGVLLIDVDDDGDQDLVAVLEDVILFMSNDGDAHFTEEASVPTSEPGSLATADYDLDGDLDVFVVNYGDRYNSGPDVYHDANNGGANALLRNDGDWKFTDVTISSGLDANNRRWSLAASWEDYDDDGDVDLYVANDFGRNNLYRNDGGHFTDIAPEAGVEDIAAGMSASWADVDHDGKMDLYVGNMFSSAGLRVTGQSRFLSQATSTIRGEFRRHARGNSLFRNIGDDRFDDVSVDAGVTIGRWAWASKFVDLNNDGWEDLVVANGFITGHQTKDL